MTLLAVGNVCRTQIEHKVYGEVAKTLDSLGYLIVKLRIFRSGDKSILQIILEKNDRESVSVNDCEKASKCISAILDTKEEFVDGVYNLEVMSTGINRPLTRPEDFERFTGQRARIKLVQKISEIGVFYGVISKFDGKVVILNQELSSIAIEFTNISDAVLDLVEKEERFKEDKKSTEYQKRFEDKRVSDRKFSYNRRFNDDSRGNRSAEGGDNRGPRGENRGPREFGSGDNRGPRGENRGPREFGSGDNRRPRGENRGPRDGHKTYSRRRST